MKRRFIPFTRLSIVFILAMVLSGGVLTYFSINNISNLKELSEKRILEEEQELANRFLNDLQNSLEELDSSLLNHPDHVGTWIDTVIRFATFRDFILQPFLIRNERHFIFPFFTGISDEASYTRLSQPARGLFQLGEEAEFAERDPAGAGKYYQSCLSRCIGAADSATALNALGRVSVKSGRLEDALGYYSLIIMNYHYLSDLNGFPFAYYAFSNLLNHTDRNHLERILPLISYGLDKMEEGEIPLNYQSGELLDQLLDWSLENRSVDTVYFSQLDHSIARLMNQVQFIEHRGDELKTIIGLGNNRKLQESQDGLSIQNVSSSAGSQFFLFKKTSAYTSGFLIDRNALFDTLVHAGIQEDLEFNYRMAFPANLRQSPTPLNSPSYSVQLNPYFPEQSLQISLLNDDLIPVLVKRRSWIYGVSTCLLLLAMMLGIILTLRDISREKRLASLRSDFISNVTHELKTPLTSIRMYAESLMMRRMKSFQGQRKYLSVIVNESERLKRMINNILEFSKMEKARQEYHRVESNLSEILQTAILDVNYWLEKDGYHLVREIEPGLQASVDPEKIHQAYTNLLSNAIKYSGDSRNIYVRLFVKNDALITEIQDEGVGIAKENQSRIFEEFYRVENHESGNITGTGLGLTVVKEIVEAHRGKIEVESEIGKGSKFSVILYQS